MSEIKSSFSRDDVETLIEAMGDWETIGNHEYHVLQMMKNVHLPSEEDEAFDAISKIKEHFRRREKEILASRATRQEKAIFLKAKLLLARRDMDVNQLFDMAAEPLAAEPADSKPISNLPASADTVSLANVKSDKYEQLYKQAEFFIQDLGVWQHYMDFLERQKESA